MKKNHYKSLCRQYLSLKIQQDQNYYQLCIGELTKAQHSLLNIHIACQMQYLESELNRLEQSLTTPKKTSSSLSQRFLSFLF